MKGISCSDVKKKLDDGATPFILDARGPDEYEQMRIGVANVLFRSVRFGPPERAPRGQERGDHLLLQDIAPRVRGGPGAGGQGLKNVNVMEAALWHGRFPGRSRIMNEIPDPPPGAGKERFRFVATGRVLLRKTAAAGLCGSRVVVAVRRRPGPQQRVPGMRQCRMSDGNRIVRLVAAVLAFVKQYGGGVFRRLRAVVRAGRTRYRPRPPAPVMGPDDATARTVFQMRGDQ